MEKEVYKREKVWNLEVKWVFGENFKKFYIHSEALFYTEASFRNSISKELVYFFNLIELWNF